MVESTTMTESQLPTSLPDFSRARVLIVGDVMLDSYWLGPTGRKSVV